MKQEIQLFLLLFLMLSACTSDGKQEVSMEKVENHEATKVEAKESKMSARTLESYNDIGLVSVTDPRILIDLRYTSSNNFMGKVLYDTIDRLYLQEEVAIRLSLCQEVLDSVQPGYRLKIFDAVRPLQVQQEMWDALDSIPPLHRGKYVSNPKYGSVHNFGTAVDITICDSLGNELDMGAGYDDFRPIAFPSKEAKFLRSGELKKEQWENRKLLRKVMRSQRFYNIPSEWWHFNAFSRSTSEKKFEILLNESGAHKKWISPKVVMDTLLLTD